MKEVATGMRENGIDMERNDREEWGSKTKLQSQKNVKTSILCT